jgi:hypothetical protein
VVKPRRGSGSAGVTVLRDPENLRSVAGRTSPPPRRRGPHLGLSQQRPVTALADPACYDEVRARLRRVLGRRPENRAAAAWDIADQALNGLAAVRDEWVGADPACTAAGGWVLVDRIGRLHLVAALLADITGRPPQDRRHIVNAARRYAWNWLRLPPPEAATQSHLRRTAELMDWIREIAP